MIKNINNDNNFSYKNLSHSHAARARNYAEYARRYADAAGHADAIDHANHA